MDPTSGPYMSYNHGSNDDYNNLFNDLSDYAAPSSEPQSSNQNAFDPALFENNSNSNGLASFQPQNQQSQSMAATFNHSQRQSQSQSPALPQFKQPQPNPYTSQHVNQGHYNPATMNQSFDPHLLSRSTASPGPFDQFSYAQQPINYGQPAFDYGYNSFQQQRPASNSSQAFRPHLAAQAPNYATIRSPSQQQQGHMSQVQSMNGMPYSFSQGHQMQQSFIDPSMLNPDGQAQRNVAGLHQAQQTISPYFPKTGTYIDPRTMTAQQYAQLQQAHDPRQSMMRPAVPQTQQSLQGLLRLAPQGTTLDQQQPQVQVVKPQTVSQDISDSEDDLEIEDDEPPDPRPASITVSKPLDERGKLLWEVVDAVWAPHNKPASTDKIRSAIKFVGDAVRGLRDTWKEANDNLKKAENSNQQTDGLKDKVQSYRETMDTLATRVTRFGHPSILKRLGENLILLSALYSFLLDRVNVDDYDSPLVVSILRLGTQLVSVDEDQLEKVKWTKILSRFTKKCTNESKTLAQQILNNAKRATARKKAEAAGQGPASPTSSSNSQIAGMKRAREGSDGAPPSKKAPVKSASKPLSVQLAEQRKQREKEKTATSGLTKVTKPSTNGASIPAVTARPKVASAPPQKSSPFAGLMSASKRPGTTIAERASKPLQPAKPAESAATLPKKDSVAKSEALAAKVAAPSAKASSFLGFLADMEKPRDAPKQRVEEDPDETPEARAKRLRKEERRKLRVTWKSESELVQTRIFEHDSEEETGHEDSQMRDVGDTGKEGEMLKKGIHADDLEDEESEDDEPVMEYFAPSEVDFSSMKQKPEDDFDSMNFYKTGGNQKPESPASKAQDEMEYGKEMVIYRPGEQPSTPKDPPETEDDDFNPVVDFGESLQPFVRQREQQVLARRQAFPQPAAPQANGFNLASALSSLQPQQPQQSQPQQNDWLSALGLTSQPQQAAQSQLDLSKILAVAQQMQQTNNYQATNTPAASTSNTTVTPNVAAILSQLGGLQQSGQQTYGAPSLPVGSGDNPNPFPGTGDASKNKKDKKRGKGGVPLDTNGLPYNYKTKVCQFWLEGKCTKGDSCTYRHDREVE